MCKLDSESAPDLCDCEISTVQIRCGFVPDTMPAQARPDEQGLLDRTLPPEGPARCVSNLCHCKAFQQALGWLRGGAPWESHVVLEALWHEARRVAAPEAHLLKALIHVAVAKLKRRAGRFVGVRRQRRKARACWEQARRMLGGGETCGLITTVADLIASV